MNRALIWHVRVFVTWQWSVPLSLELLTISFIKVIYSSSLELSNYSSSTILEQIQDYKTSTQTPGELSFQWQTIWRFAIYLYEKSDNLPVSQGSFLRPLVFFIYNLHQWSYKFWKDILICFICWWKNGKNVACKKSVNS